MELSWGPVSAVCVVIASAGYPGNYVKGKPIEGLAETAAIPNLKVFHAGTARQGELFMTNGGRVLGVTAWARNLKEARATAYSAVEKIRFEGAHFRRDIGSRGL